MGVTRVGVASVGGANVGVASAGATNVAVASVGVVANVGVARVGVARVGVTSVAGGDVGVASSFGKDANQRRGCLLTGGRPFARRVARARARSARMGAQNPLPKVARPGKEKKERCLTTKLARVRGFPSLSALHSPV